MIEEDLYRYIPQKYSLLNLIKGFRIPGFCYTYFLRKSAQTSKYSFAGIFYRILLRKYTYKFGIQISTPTKIGKGFYIGHFGNVVISSKAIIGNYCNISQGVTIGQIYIGSKIGAPHIADYVWMGTNSIIVGGIKIGPHVLIAPGAFVNFDVPPHSVVVGNPGKIIPKQNPTTMYIENILNKEKN